MGLRKDDLQDTVIKSLSIDEFEPKTGDSKDVIVLGFKVIEQNVGKDLYNYINNSVYDIRDVEVSPNPNPDDHHVVFVEIDRGSDSLENIRNIVKDVENISGKLEWVASTHLTDESFPLNGPEIEQYVLLDPENYMSRDEWQDQQVQASDAEPLEEDTTDHDAIMEFLERSDLQEVRLEDNVLHLAGRGDTVQLEFINYGEAADIMSELGINESALKPLDSVYRKFNSMLGEMRAVPVDDYVVIYHPDSTNVIVGKQT